jgi:C4-dicarboxylate-binding protein DctP
MKIGYATANDAQDEVGRLFAREVERLSQGRIKVAVYPGSQLGNNEKMNNDVRTGVQEVLLQPVGFAAPYVPTMGVLDLPFLFPNDEVQTRVLNSSATELLRQQGRTAGVEILSFYGNGFKNFATKFPVQRAEDLRGRKFRVIQSPELVSQMKAFGAIGVPMPLAEVYTALQQGIVEGIENPEDVVVRHKHHEVAKYYTYSNHGALSSGIFVNKRWFDSLPRDLQDAVRKAGEAAAREAPQIMKRHQQSAAQEMVRSGVTISRLPEAEVAKLREASKAVWEEIRKDAQKAQLLDALLRELGGGR